MADDLKATAAAPVLPPEPWYLSEVQVRLVISALAQILSICLRVAKRYLEIDLTSEDIELIAADVLQGVAILFGLLAIVKRQRSPIQPLTMTKGEARAREATAQIDPKTLEKKAA